MVSRNPPVCAYQNCNTSQVWIFRGYVKVRESLYTQVIIRANTMRIPFKTILILWQFCLGMKIHAWNIEPNDVKNENTIKYP